MRHKAERFNRHANGCRKHDSIVILACTPTHCSADTQKDKLHDEPFTLVRNNKGSGIVVVEGDFSTKVGKLGASVACLGGRCALFVQRTDKEDRFLQFYADSRLLLSGSNFRHTWRRTATWRSDSKGSLNQVDHIVVNYHLGGSA